ncbi:MAG: patatin-like phospholipase family protein [Spirochaetales bacterium]|nr:patatin-like phospholipase family protein [Spirochaetales bacterium]
MAIFTNNHGKKHITILSIDGGGIRGVIPLTILKEFQKMMTEKGLNSPLYSYFDLISGTSTGGLIALGLTAPSISSSAEFEESGKAKESTGSADYTGNLDLKADRSKAESSKLFSFLTKRRAKHYQKNILPSFTIEKILEIYEKRGEDIFPRSSFGHLKAFEQMFIEKYSEETLESLLKELFGNLTMHDSLGKLLIVSYDCLRGAPFLFTSYGKKNFYMREAGRATSAAPTYFSPLITHPIGRNEKFCFIDGGTAANNPSLYAYLEAKKLFPWAEHFHILSISTSQKKFTLPLSKVRGMGFFDWITPSKGVPLMNIYSSSQYFTVNETLECMPDVTYHRIHSDFQDLPIRMDDASKENIERMKKAAVEIIDEHRSSLNEFIKRYLIK